MKKYFNKFIIVFLLTTIFFMASSFCFHGLLGLTFNEAKAAASENIKINESESDPCFEAQNNEQKEIKEPITPLKTSHQNSLLPCCVSEARPVLISSILQMPEILKYITVTSIIKHLESQPLIILKIYHAPITSPPELLALKSTILRI